MPVAHFRQQSQEAIRSAIEVNFYGVLNGCQLVLSEMVRCRSGHIVNIASLAGMVAVPGQVVYAGTKFTEGACPPHRPTRSPRPNFELLIVAG